MTWGATTDDWTSERRLAMSQWMHEHKPWERSTGPRTARGKDKVSANALKSGTRSASVKQAASVAYALNRIEKELLAE